MSTTNFDKFRAAGKVIDGTASFRNQQSKDKKTIEKEVDTALENIPKQDSKEINKTEKQVLGVMAQLEKITDEVAKELGGEAQKILDLIHGGAGLEEALQRIAKTKKARQAGAAPSGIGPKPGG